jgi:hypothetical protein
MLIETDPPFNGAVFSGYIIPRREIGHNSKGTVTASMGYDKTSQIRLTRMS